MDGQKVKRTGGKVNEWIDNQVGRKVGEKVVVASAVS
jgi:hypothetical protein